MLMGKDLLGFSFLPEVTRVRDFEIFSKKAEGNFDGNASGNRLAVSLRRSKPPVLDSFTCLLGDIEGRSF